MPHYHRVPTIEGMWTLAGSENKTYNNQKILKLLLAFYKNYSITGKIETLTKILKSMKWGSKFTMWQSEVGNGRAERVDQHRKQLLGSIEMRQ